MKVMLFQAWFALSLSGALASVTFPKNEVCYDVVGCFYLGKPWHSETLPMRVPRDPKTYLIQALFYQNPHEDDAHRFDLYPKVDLDKIPFNPHRNKTFVIVPGMFYSPKRGWVQRLKDGILKEMDANVIVVITTPIIQIDDHQVGADMRVVAVLVAHMIAEFKLKGADYNTMHLIGMDRSAHCVGLVGKMHKVGRITGLDPYGGISEKGMRIDKDDADFVDIIHTDARPRVPQNGFGLIDAVGHVDIYVNGGSYQPGCDLPGQVSIHEDDTLFSFVRRFSEQWNSAFWCNHIRSALLFEEAVTNTDCIIAAYEATNENIFQAFANSRLEKPSNRYTAIMKNCTDTTCTAMGLYTELFPFRGSAVLTTNSQSPYCRTKGPTELISRQHTASVHAWYYKWVERKEDPLPFLWMRYKADDKQNF